MDDMADMLSALVDGGIILSKIVHDRELLSRQLMLYREMVRAVFVGRGNYKSASADLAHIFVKSDGRHKTCRLIALYFGTLSSKLLKYQLYNLRYVFLMMIVWIVACALSGGARQPA